MTPQEHYRHAERILRELDQMTHDDARTALAAAQVHATLATAPRPPRYHDARGTIDDPLDRD